MTVIENTPTRPQRQGNPRLERFYEAYLLMASKANYRSQAPGDGWGHVLLSRAQLRDRKRLENEAFDYVLKFDKEEDTRSFWIGTSNFSTNRAFVWIIEAARQLAGGEEGNATAIKLLEMATEEVKQQQHPRRREKVS
jgi:hypothetical protein